MSFHFKNAAALSADIGTLFRYTLGLETDPVDQINLLPDPNRLELVGSMARRLRPERNVRFETVCH